MIFKLNSPEKRQTRICPCFFEWVVLKRMQNFIDIAIVSARDGTNLNGLYYQNDIESINFVEKMRRYFSKKSVSEVTKPFELFHNRQDQDEVRALYGAGPFSLATKYEKFKVDST